MKTQCLDIETLYHYITGQISSREMEAMEKHLLECDDCLDEFISANALLKEKVSKKEEVAPKILNSHILETIKARLKRFYKWITQPPAAALIAEPVRSGRASSEPDTSESDTFQKYIKLSRSFDKLHTDILFNISGSEKFSMFINSIDRIENEKKILIILGRPDNRYEARPLKECRAEFQDMPFGTYSLVLEQNGVQTGQIAFEIDGAGLNEK
ncbi:zf-HC2 domain-containing protein [Desulfobacterales bacterium HSG16]|nr:zf-HC2 domain-containing protein [Desulfobacterales bacterium HSG16]